MSPVVIAFAWGFGAVCVLVVGIILWAGWASREALSQDMEQD